MALFSLLWISPSQAQNNTNAASKPVVVELFTSQSCASCPPADKSLTELAANPNIIALGFHVTYWNHLNWQDTLSREFATNRQRAYAKTMRTRNVYTPQMIVNGKTEFIGSHKDELHKALREASLLRPITIRTRGSNAFEMTLPQLANDGHLNYTLTLFGLKNHEKSTITRGENAGKSVIYTNPVIYSQSLGSWLGNAEKRTLSLPPGAPLETIVILANAGNHGEITAAGKITLK